MRGAVILLVGRAGAGKDEQAKRLPWAWGDMGGYMREKEQVDIVKEYMHKGVLAPDDLTCRLFDGLLSRVAVRSPGVLKTEPSIWTGFPRTIHQAKYLFKKAPDVMKITVYLKLEREVAVQRILGRSDNRVDDKDRAAIDRRQDTFNQEFLPTGGLLDFLRLNTTFLQFDDDGSNLPKEEAIRAMSERIMPPLYGALRIPIPRACLVT